MAKTARPSDVAGVRLTSNWIHFRRSCAAPAVVRVTDRGKQPYNIQSLPNEIWFKAIFAAVLSANLTGGPVSAKLPK
jgi:hypothetical protein